MSNYVSKVKIAWVPTKCTNPKCNNEDEAASLALVDGHAPKCDVCGSPMQYDKGDPDDQA